MADHIRIEGLRVMAPCGVSDAERSVLQPLEVTVTLRTDLSVAGRTDDLADTVDYGAVAVAVADAAARGARLLEAVAERVAGVVLADGRVSAVTVEVRKLRPPVPLDVAATAVRIERSR